MLWFKEGLSIYVKLCVIIFIFMHIYPGIIHKKVTRGHLRDWYYKIEMSKWADKSIFSCYISTYIFKLHGRNKCSEG